MQNSLHNIREKKTKDLLIILAIYVLSFLIGYVCCVVAASRMSATGTLGAGTSVIMMKLFVFDVVATCVVFIFSVILHNSSVYDAYWSVAPMVMIIWFYVEEKVFSVRAVIFLIVFLTWSLRLTLNWIEVFTDFSYEDWRYRKFRDETPRVFWPVVNFFGIHMMPTLVVFAGMLPIFDMERVGNAVVKTSGISPVMSYIMILPGIIIMLFGIMMEYFADRQMHAFLSSEKRGGVCDIGLWKYSRHPNYLGEISFWVGVYFAIVPYAREHWYYGIGCLSVCILFNVVSIPLMEKRQLSRRPAYVEYKKKTSRLLLRPPKRVV